MRIIGERNFGNFRWPILLTFLVICTALFDGCVYSLQSYNQASQEKVRVKSAMPQQYTMNVADEIAHPVAGDGRVIVDVPQLQRGCDTYLFNIVKIRDGSPYNLRAIQLKRNNRGVCKLSLNDIAKLPVDEEGYHVLEVK
jgi:hypothetical protein